MDVFESIQTRRSIGLTHGSVSDDVLHQLIEAATWAPNHRLTQPWRFTIINGTVLVNLAARLAELENDPQQKKKLGRSPAVIVVSVVRNLQAEVAREDRDATAAAIQNMLLAAHALGLGAIWRTGSYIASAHFAKLIALPENEQIVGLVCIGIPSIEPVTQLRNRGFVTRTLDQIP